MVNRQLRFSAEMSGCGSIKQDHWSSCCITVRGHQCRSIQGRGLADWLFRRVEGRGVNVSVQSTSYSFDLWSVR